METTGEGHASNFPTFHKFRILLINLTIVFLFKNITYPNSYTLVFNYTLIIIHSFGFYKTASTYQLFFKDFHRWTKQIIAIFNLWY